MDVIVSSGGKYHAYHLARASARSGSLRRFITTIYDGREPGIDRSLVRQIPLPELLAQVIWRLPGANSIYWSYAVRDNLFDRWSARHIDGGDIFNVFNHFGLHAMRKAKALGMKTVVERSAAHPVIHERILRTEYERYGLRFARGSQMLFKKQLDEYTEADAIVVPSDFVWRTMIEGGVPEEKLRRVHFGFDPGRFHPGAKTDSTFRVVFVGSVSLQKGVQYLLEAFRRLDLPDAELVLVGSRFPDSNAFLPQYEGLYRYVPFVPHEELPALYQAASVFVLPSLQDGFGMVVYEAAACGLPIIVTDNVGAPIREGVDGFRVPIRDPDALAHRLRQFYEDDALRRAMGRAAHEYVQQFTWEAYHRQVLENYRDLLAT